MRKEQKENAGGNGKGKKTTTTRGGEGMTGEKKKATEHGRSFSAGDRRTKHDVRETPLAGGGGEKGGKESIHH